MDNKKLRILIETNLKQDERLRETGCSELNMPLLFELLDKNDEKIINILLLNHTTREKFCVKIRDFYVFKTNDFKLFMKANKFDNTNPVYNNRIELSNGESLLNDNRDIVLDFPYKDYVLDDGHGTKEGTVSYYEYSEKTFKYEEKHTKRKEIIFNQAFSTYEIEQLCDEKALVNWKRFTKDGKEEVKEIKRDKDGSIRENLIIKGNNLLVLHSLKNQFSGKVKLIYIDPPYNTGKDGFKYNDNFHHSTWLTLMKNRLEVARTFLRDDGVIVVSCDDNEHAYLKVLMDEIFSRNNFIVNFVWETKKGAQGIITQNMIVNNHENLIVFAKNKESFAFNGTDRNCYEFNNPDKDPRGLWKRQYLQRFGHGFKQKTIVNPANGMKFTFETPYAQEKLDRWIQDNSIIFPEDTHKYPARKEFLAEYKNKKQLVSSLGLFSTKSSTEELYSLFDGKKIFRNPKPETIIKFVIEQCSNVRDIVLDYYLGSGTTAAVAHKMGRQYIGIEQIDYIENIVCERLRKVIAGEQSGISKVVNWRNGGDFIYCELATWNAEAQKLIMKSKNFDALLTLFDEFYEKYFLNYYIKVKEFRESLVNEREFRELSLEKQKSMCATMLNISPIHISYSEINNTRYKINKSDKKMSDAFFVTPSPS